MLTGANANLNPNTALHIDPSRDERAPLLILGGDTDHVVPAAVTRANFKQYAQSSAVTEHLEFPGRSHFTVGEPGWEAVADTALEWASEHAR